MRKFSFRIDFRFWFRSVRGKNVKVGGEGENFARVVDDTSAVARCELDRLSSRQTRCAEFTAHRACMRARHNHCNFTDFLFLSPWESHVRRVNLHLRRLLFCHLNPVCNLSSLERTRKKNLCQHGLRSMKGELWKLFDQGWIWLIDVSYPYY